MRINMTNRVTIVWSDGASVRSAPNINGTKLATLPKDTSYITESNVVNDTTEPTNPDKKWIAYGNGYIATRYPSSSGNPVRATVEIVGQTPPDSKPEFMDVIFDDGSTVKYKRIDDPSN
jgi:hypothetical protein